MQIEESGAEVFRRLHRLEIRCSSLPRVLSCPASLHRPSVVIEGDDETSSLGTAAHRCFEKITAGLEVPYTETARLATVYDVDVDELRLLVNLGRQCWSSLASSFPTPRIERKLSYTADGITLTGSPDVWDIVDGQARVPDFKTGRSVRGHDEQLKGYALLIAKNNPEVTEAWGTTINVRARENGNIIVMQRGELDDWWGDLVETVSQEHFRPSHEACIYCPRRFNCPARQELLQSAAGVLIGSVENMPLPEEPMRLGVLAARHLAKVAAEYLDAVKAHVEINGTHDADLDAVGINGLQVRTQKENHLNEAAWPLLVQQLGLEKVQACSTLGKGKIEKAIGEIAPKGQKGKLIAETMKVLKDAGCMDEKEKKILEVIDLKEIP